ncbi:MAG: glycoside hydrolase family 9 protein, partial [Verrucomicrobia bacterium]|nr:glycoside hydrolase family 9 protein [Verrucomicrobiota bacterium]
MKLPLHGICLLAAVLASSPPAPASEVDYLNLTLPVVGDHALHVLAPTTLQLIRINTKPPGLAPVENWDLVDADGVFHAPALALFAVTVDGVPATITGIGFKRRPFYAPLFVRDLRIENSLYLQLSTPIAEGQVVEVKNPGGLLWPATETYLATTTPLRYGPAIHVNQEGYVPGLPKKAMVGSYLGSLGELNVPASSGFTLVTAGTGTVVFSGTLTLRPDVGYVYSPMPYQKVLEADFSAFTTPGRYQLRVPGLGASLPFAIDEGIAMSFLRTYALGLYHQRCGTDNAMPFTRFVHDACHVAAAEVPSPSGSYTFTWATIAGKNGDFATNPRHTAPQLNGEASQLYPFVNQGTVDVAGGHHDAGDYSKYTMNSTALAHLLLFTADAIPGAAALDNLGLPESGDGTSDILQEAKQETDYISKLQDADGGFYFIVYPKTREYESNVLPDHGDTQVVWPKNTAATAAAVAALAQAASSPRFKAAYPAAAALYLKKARLGWQFLLNAIAAHGKDGAYQKITFYGDNYMHDDELAWAACELFVATGEAQYRQKLFEWFPDPSDSLTFRWGWWRMSESWGNAIRSYAFAVRTGRLTAGQLDAAYLAKCEAQIVAAGDDALRWSNQNSYATSFPEETKRVQSAGWYFSLDQASDMAVAYQVSPKAAYLDALVGNLNYEAGTNPVNVTYLTGLGRKRQRETVSQYALNDHRVLPPDGIPLGNIQTTFDYLAPYGTELRELAFPSDGATTAPYEFYDRWADTFNVTTEYIGVNQARSLLSLTVLATRTTTQAQSWRSGVAQIVVPPSVALLNAPVTLTVQAPAVDLTGARIVWEARDQEPAFGPPYTISPKNNGPQWVEAEIALPDGRRLFAVNSFPANSTVVNWVGGAIPTGGSPGAFGGDAWTWVTPTPATPSGRLAHQSNLAAGEHGHLFELATATVHVGIGDEMFAWVYLDPLNPPTEVMLTWNDPSTEHRAYWGANTITWGSNESAGRRYVGPLPATGEWVRLSVPASAVGLEGSTVNGMAFVLVDGRATWDTAGVTTAVAPATAPAIAAQPQPQTATVGGSATFTVSVTGTAPFTYQWTHRGVTLPAATGATLTLANAQTAQAGTYAVTVTNAVDHVLSASASLTVNPGAGAPFFSLQPQSQSLNVGASITYTAAASGTAPLTYQWKRNGRPISGATSPSLTITGAAPVRDNGWYQLVASNASGATESSTVFVNVAVSPLQIAAWGRNTEGETTVPVGLADAVSLVAGGAHSVALKANGTVVAWGRNTEGQTTIPVGLTNVVAIAAGLAHTVALRGDGTVVAWGSNDYGQATVPPGLTGIVSVAAGGYHTVALRANGTAVVWGDNRSGQTTAPSDLSDLIAIAAGAAHTLGLRSDGTVVAWGYNNSGQTAVPSALTGVIAIAAGDHHSAALRADGTVAVWGWNGYGQAAVPGGLGAVAGPAAGGAHTAARQADGTVRAWGDNTLGQTAVPAGLVTVFGLAAGGNHTLALRDARVRPVITAPPSSQSAALGQPVTLTLTASGMPTPTLQWRKAGANIAGATGTSYVIPAMTAADAGDYDGVATNSLDAVPSAIATVAFVKSTPTVTWSPPASIAYGVALGATQLNATASVTGTFTYNPPAGTVLGVGSAQALAVTFAPTDSATYNTVVGATALTVTANFASWRAGVFTAPELADPAKSGPNAVFGLDGYPNLVKYALGLDPRLNVTAGLPEVSVQSPDWVCLYTRPTAPTDLAYTVETSTNLSAWSTAGVTHELVSTSAGLATWRARVPLAAATNLFFRLKVVRLASDTAYAPPVGGMTLIAPAAQARSISLPLLHASTGAGTMLGRIGAVGTNYLDVPTAGWTPGGLSAAANPYYVRFRTGALAGRVMLVSTAAANTTSRVFLGTDGTDLTLAGVATGAQG